MNLNHIAIIMDGNRRWATLHNTSIRNGHKKGAETLMNLCKNFKKYAIPHLTVYAFSNENNRRSSEEKDNIFSMLEEYLDGDIKKLQQENIKVQFIGDFSVFSQKIQEKITKIHSITHKNPFYTLNVALNYGGRQEICYAFSKIQKRDITDKDVSQNLYQPNIPDVDFLIRTGGMQRLSNFLTWQTTYAELYFCKCLWPDFNEHEFKTALDFYQIQQRNFGY